MTFGPNGRSLRQGTGGAVSPPFVELDTASGMPDMFARFRELPYPMLLDSSLSRSMQGRFSYLTADPFLTVRSKGRRVWI